VEVVLDKEIGQPRSAQLLRCHSMIHKEGHDVLYGGTVSDAPVRGLNLTLSRSSEDRVLTPYVIRNLHLSLQNCRQLPSELEIQWLLSFKSLERLDISFIGLEVLDFQITDMNIQPKSHAIISILTLTWDKDSRRRPRTRRRPTCSRV
jgi:hypothetical protein